MTHKLPSLRPKEVCRVLKKMGFVEKRQSGSHLILQHYETRRRTVIAIHNKDLKRGTLNAILRQAGIRSDDFLKCL